MYGRINPPRSGFTLIELVVVLLIIAILAGLAVPIVNMLARSADMAASAKTQADLANNIQLFFTLQKRYPQGLDSLIESGGSTIYAADNADPNLQATGMTATGINGNPPLASSLSVATLTGNQRRSFTRSGFDWVYDHTRSGVNASNSGTARRDVASASSIPVAVLDPASAYALALLPTYASNGPEAGTQLVVLGIGPSNSAISKTITNCPTFPGNDGKYYGRYLAVFKVYDTGERATLVGVMDAFGRTPDYTQQQFNESLPNGGRQP